MSKFDADHAGTRGYFLFENTHTRLQKLRDHMEFLTQLAQPRTYDEEEDAPPEVAFGQVAICLELLAEQAGLVLDEAAWSQRRAALHDDEGADDEHPDGEDDPDADEDVHGDTLVFGVTLAQAEALKRWVEIATAHDDGRSDGEGDTPARQAPPVTWKTIHEGVQALVSIIEQLESQPLGRAPRPRTHVREAPAHYGAPAVRRRAVGASDVTVPLPLRVQSGGRGQRPLLH